MFKHVVNWLSFLDRNLNSNSLILDLGCGSAKYSLMFEHRKYIGVDLPSTWYNPVRKIDVYATADKLPFKDNCFDLIFSVSSFDYFENPQLVLSEIARILKISGKFIIFTYDKKLLQIIHERCKKFKNSPAHFGHHVFDFQALSNMAKQANLKIKKLPYEPRMRIIDSVKWFIKPREYRSYLLYK